MRYHNTPPLSFATHCYPPQVRYLNTSMVGADFLAAALAVAAQLAVGPGAAAAINGAQAAIFAVACGAGFWVQNGLGEYELSVRIWGEQTGEREAFFKKQAKAGKAEAGGKMLVLGAAAAAEEGQREAGPGSSQPKLSLRGAVHLTRAANRLLPPLGSGAGGERLRVLSRAAESKAAHAECKRAVQEADRALKKALAQAAQAEKKAQAGAKPKREKKDKKDKKDKKGKGQGKGKITPDLSAPDADDADAVAAGAADAEGEGSAKEERAREAAQEIEQEKAPAAAQKQKGKGKEDLESGPADSAAAAAATAFSEAAAARTSAEAAARATHATALERAHGARAAAWSLPGSHTGGRRQRPWARATSASAGSGSGGWRRERRGAGSGWRTARAR